MQSRLASLEPPPPCAECRERVPGIRWGDLCPDCRARLARRASRWARGISLLAAMVVVWYAFATMRLTAGTRVWIAGIAVATYFLVRRIVTQIAIEILRGKRSS
jgi:hypothetical protein